MTKTMHKGHNQTLRYHSAQGRSQEWPKEGVLRPKIVKGGGFEDAETLHIHARVLVKITK